MLSVDDIKGCEMCMLSVDDIQAGIKGCEMCMLSVDDIKAGIKGCEMFSGLHQWVDVTGQRLLMWRVIWVYTGSISLPRYYTNMLSYNIFHTQMYSQTKGLVE